MGIENDKTKHGENKEKDGPESENRCLALKTRSADKLEVMIYLKFKEPYRSHAELLNALSFILQEKIKWTSSDKAQELLTDSGLH